ncbi:MULTISPECIES: pyridoxamine 5'-phosphate oxidase family protein [unclassified Nocardioides]|uniref:pyridoxamine 5'-phosphate oxidase family protein n=1 Tax=Nocardioides sp. URHA0032 TaxID=1380388 RepID=UPI000564C12E|nr:TIGR03618 family F420-dependent PPOX class oxidoreductase [Nocardioides sp. URHA0032]
MTSWRPGWDDFPQALLDFWTERRLCTLTTLRADGLPHVVPVGAVLDLEERCAWVITNASSQKARNLEHSAVVAICQVEGRHWSTLEGRAAVRTDEASVRRAEVQYAGRYREPSPNPLRVGVRIEVDRFLASRGLV